MTHRALCLNDTGCSDKHRGYYRAVCDGRCVEARYQLLSDGRWHGALSLDEWVVKATFAESKEEIRAWCFEAWAEALGIGQRT